ncbi:MAG: hypothetical protein EAZ55_11700 [Cytophagales bacterium]|nr:MAG: hypothetical protein EAZ55_11700 [Cytophagales bacterium]
MLGLKENGYSVESVTESGNNVLISFGKGKEEKDPCEDAIEGLAETALHHRGNDGNGLTWITWVFNCNRKSINKQTDWLTNSKRADPNDNNKDKSFHAEDAFNEQFDNLKVKYEADYEPVERVDILIKFSPCHCFNSKHPKLKNTPVCTGVLANLKAQYPNVEFNVYYMVQYDRGNWHSFENCVKPSFKYLEDIGIKHDFFVKVLSTRSSLYSAISEYTSNIARFKFDY